MTGMNNDYRHLLDRAVGSGAQHSSIRQPVSVVIPTFNRRTYLERALAAFTHQTYQRNLLEIIIADDGSTDGVEAVVRRFESYFELVHVRQQDRGHRLAAVCNLGLRTARHDNLVLLQCDMIPHPALLATYMQVLSHVSEAILIGNRLFTCADNLSADEVLADPGFASKLPLIKTNNQVWGDSGGTSEDWRIRLYRATNLLVHEMWPYRAVVGSNLAFRRSLLNAVGPFDERFEAWGCEDGEFGYRAYNSGFFFIPLLAAVGFHQEPRNGKNETDRVGGYEKTRTLQEELCALPPFRTPHANRSFAVPKISLCCIARCAIWLPEFLQEEHLRDIEVIVVRPASVPEVLLPGTRNSVTVREVTLPEGTLASLVNIAVRTSRGPYICHIESERPPPLGILRSLMRRLDVENIGCVLHEFETRCGSGEADGTCEAARSFCAVYRKRDWSRRNGFGTAFRTLDAESLRRELSAVCVVVDGTQSEVCTS